MATATAFTAARMKAIEDSCIVNGAVLLDDLILTRHDGTQVNAGNVRGPKGDKGDKGLKGDQGIQGIQGVKGDQGPIGPSSPSDAAATPNTLALRTSTGTVKGAAPAANDDLVTKLYADGIPAGTELASGVDLNLIATPGVYTQSLNSKAAAGVNYPTPYAGVLEVFSNTTREYTLIWQRYVPYAMNGVNTVDVFYQRSWVNTAGWTAWQMYSPSNVAWNTVTAFAASVQTLVAAGYGPVRYRIVGDRVEWNGPVQTTIARSGNWVMLTVPAAAKPKYHQQMIIHTGSVGGYGVTSGLWFDVMCYVDSTTGLMTAYAGASTTWAANGYVFLNGSYPLL